ncbi:AHH domain-containing protein [Myxococcus sp. RHSTA-1-4]|uniref:AHH domain-containing protein n=1 Tax=Myxococcus sp. RHSTA-1-4 TaxID=2874601 RepID=UPI001CBAB9E9|nr:AHH domain-containing protein [Myxococcus sp. RHSTA-1-4]MBZ4421580.1 AHH domain-containing protein [Myxococcus sp. RHSTA-1-4]
MRTVGAIGLLLLAAGCATTRVVHLDTGHGEPVTYKPVDVAPVEVSEDEFKAALTQLVLGMRLDVVLRETDEEDRRGWARSRTLLASSKGMVDLGAGRAERSPEALYSRICPEPDSCLPLMGGTGMPFGAKERTLLALSFALDTVWEGVEDALGKMLNPVALKALVASAALSALVMMTLPEPVTKVIAVALSAALVAYLGVIPVWEMGRGFVRLWDEAEKATNVVELQDIGHRFGRVLGTNGTRVLVLVVTTALGGNSAMAAQGPRLPGFPQAAFRARAEGGFQLEAALAGEVSSISLPAAGVLNVALAPGAVAAVAMYSNGQIPGDAEGPVHHICTNKNTVSAASGGPWTPICEEIFEKAGMSLEDVANKVRLKGHEGPHPERYHQAVTGRLREAVQRCKTTEDCRAELVNELARIASELLTPGSRLRSYIVKMGD